MRLLLRIQAGLARRFGKLQRAAELYREGLRLEPDHPSLLGRLGRTLAEAGDQAGALAVFQRLVEVQPKLAGAHYNIGFLKDATGDTDGALQAFATAIELNPELDRAWYGRGLILERRGQHRDALTAYEGALKAEPMCQEARFRAGQMHETLGEYEDVERIIARLKVDHPQFAWQLMQQVEKRVSAAQPTEPSTTEPSSTGP